MTRSSLRDQSKSRSRSRSTTRSRDRSESFGREKRSRHSKSPPRPTKKKKQPGLKDTELLGKRRSTVAEAFSKLEEEKKAEEALKREEEARREIQRRDARPRDHSSGQRNAEAEQPKGSSAKQGAQEIQEGQDPAKPDSPIPESADKDSIEEEALDFISLEVDEPLEAAPASQARPEEAAQPGAEPQGADDSAQWYTDAYGNWISAEEYKQQWELYNQYAEAQKQEPVQETQEQAIDASAGAKISTYAEHLEGGLEGELTEEAKAKPETEKEKELEKGKESSPPEKQQQPPADIAQPSNGYYAPQNGYYDYSYYPQYYGQQGYYDPSYHHQYLGSYVEPPLQRQTSQPPPGANETLYVKNIGSMKDEDELVEFLQGYFEGVKFARILRDRERNFANRGFGFVKFDSVESAVSALEKSTVDPIRIEKTGETLRFRYSFKSLEDQPDSSKGWTCPSCLTENEESSTECSQCSTSRPIVAYGATLEETSSTILITGLPYETKEEEIWAVLHKIGKPAELIFVRDKATGAFKAHCYVKFGSNADAHEAQDELEKGMEVAERRVQCNVSFAQDHSKKQFATEDGLQVAHGEQPPQSGPVPNWPPNANSYSQPQHPPSYGAPPPGFTPPAYGQSSGFQYDPTTGYHLDAATGLYWDANSGLYYDGQNWMQMDPNTGQLYPIAQPQNSWTSTAAEAALMAANAAALTRNMGELHAPEIEYRPPVDGKKRGPIIGSAPKLNQENVLSAAKQAALAKAAKEEDQRRKEVAMALHAKRQQQTKASVIHRAGAAPAAAPIPKPAPPPYSPPQKQPPPRQAAATIAQQLMASTVGVPSAAAGSVKGVIRVSGKTWGAK